MDISFPSRVENKNATGLLILRKQNYRATKTFVRAADVLAKDHLHAMSVAGGQHDYSKVKCFHTKRSFTEKKLTNPPSFPHPTPSHPTSPPARKDFYSIQFNLFIMYSDQPVHIPNSTYCRSCNTCRPSTLGLFVTLNIHIHKVYAFRVQNSNRTLKV